MLDKQTSDERLLKLIEGSEGPQYPKGPSLGGRKSAARSLPFKLSLPELKLKFKSSKLNLAILNKCLSGLALLLTLVFLYMLIRGLAVSKNNLLSFNVKDTKAIAKLISSGEALGQMRKNISSQDLKRDFFLPAGQKAKDFLTDEEEDIAAEAKDLKLVGIVWSQNPEVMIENSKDARTYILKKGDFLDDQFMVKEISRSSVTLVVVTQSGPKDYVLR